MRTALRFRERTLHAPFCHGGLCVAGVHKATRRDLLAGGKASYSTSHQGRCALIE
ncbi:MAG TPA: hypothetical protein VFV38_04645 [Ktedonobacteraceae bacterium]|nr:hypothetical protein [Ktedonobacteraceae bacterium]